MKIEQLLHGYDNGHRLLAGSVLLKNPADQDAVATLSDWSEYAVSGDNDSTYITAYPLLESQYYVIAKTWYASEMKRPGCVWTHSLLIPFGELNKIDDYRRLLKLFTRPAADDNLDKYSRTIGYENKPISFNEYEPESIDRAIALSILYSFIKREAEPVFFSANENNKSIESILLSTMNVLPASILLETSWCSGTAYMRKLFGKPLTCQFLPRTINRESLIIPTEKKGCFDYVLDGIMRGDVNQGQVIRMFADDIGNSSEKYAYIVKALYTLEDYFRLNNSSESRYEEVLNIIASGFPTAEEGHIIKKLLTNKSFSDRYCSDSVFFFLFSTLHINGIFDVTDTRINARWSEFVSSNRSLYVPLLSRICGSGNANEWGASVIRQSADILSKDELKTILNSDIRLFETLTHLAPGILNSISLNDISSQEFETIVSLILDRRIQTEFSNWTLLFSVMLERGFEISNQLAELVFSKNNNATEILLDFINEDDKRYAGCSLIKQLENRTDNILSWLRKINNINSAVAFLIASTVVAQSSSVHTAGAGIWTPFLNLQFQQLRTEVYTFLFSLSFNWPSDRIAIELLRKAFYPIHILQANGKLGYRNWARISDYLESVMIWDEWDYCKKLRKTVVKRLKHAGYDKSVLLHFTPDEDLNILLIKMW